MISYLAHGSQRRHQGNVSPEDGRHEIEGETDVVGDVREQPPLFDVAVHVRRRQVGEEQAPDHSTPVAQNPDDCGGDGGGVFCQKKKQTNKIDGVSGISNQNIGHPQKNMTRTIIKKKSKRIRPVHCFVRCVGLGGGRYTIVCHCP